LAVPYLLQDLANGMDSSDEDQDEEDEVWQRLRYSRWGVHNGTGKDDTEAAYKAALGRASHTGQHGESRWDGGGADVRSLRGQQSRGG